MKVYSCFVQYSEPRWDCIDWIPENLLFRYISCEDGGPVTQGPARAHDGESSIWWHPEHWHWHLCAFGIGSVGSGGWEKTFRFKFKMMTPIFRCCAVPCQPWIAVRETWIETFSFIAAGELNLLHSFAFAESVLIWYHANTTPYLFYQICTKKYNNAKTFPPATLNCHHADKHRRLVPSTSTSDSSSCHLVR